MSSSITAQVHATGGFQVDARAAAARAYRRIALADGKVTAMEHNQVAYFSADEIKEAFDYVIVGGGGNGSIVANKIAKADPSAKVLLLEAGKKPPEANIDIWDPKNWVELQHDPDLEWAYESTCQEEMYGRVIPLSRCAALGGSTVHHSFLWVRGGKKAHDDWANSYGCPGWTWEKFVPYFEEFEAELPGVIGDDAKDSEWEKALIKASIDCGMPWNIDYNNKEGIQDGTSYIRYYPIRDGRRVTMYQYFVELPQKNGELKNLIVRDDALVTRLLFEKRGTEHKVYGVQYRPYTNHSGPVMNIKVNREVIMTAGAIGNPQILNLSGIGDSTELQKAGIAMIRNVELPGVGKNLVDDVFVINNYTTNKELPDGFMSNGIGGVINFIGKFQITNQSTRMPGMFNIAEEWKPGFQISMDVHEIKSRGYVHLDKNNLYGVPIINLNYLKEEEDVEACVQALKILRKVAHNDALKAWEPKEVMPKPEVKDDNDEALRCYIRATSGTTFHFSGTCRMGTKTAPFATPPVVNPKNLKVYQFQNLRIMDASIFPQNPNGNPQATSYCIAAIGAKMVIDDMTLK